MDINGYNSEGRTPLHMVVASEFIGRDNLGSYLIDHGAWTEAPDFDNNTPLLEAAKLGHKDSVQMLLERQADPSKRGSDGFTPLQNAVSMGHVEVARVLCGSEEVDINVRDPEGCTPLHDCATNGFDEMTPVLLEFDADVDARENEGFTPLMYAVAARQPKVCEILLEAGADADLSDNMQRTAMHFAAAEGYADVIETLVEADINMSPKDGDGDTPLHAAALAGHVEAFRALMGNGADSSAVNNDGDQCVHLACENGLVEIVEVLIEYSADMDIMNNEGLTPLGCARMNGHDSIVKLIDECYMPERFKRKHKRPELTLEEWEARRERSELVLSMNNWKEYKDPLTTTAFYFSTEGRAVAQDPSGEDLSYTWDEPLELTALYDTGIWERAWNEEQGTEYYHNLITGEVRWTEPPVDPYRLRLVAQAKRKRLHKRVQDHKGHGDATATDYLAFYDEEFGEIRQMKREDWAASMIQNCFRRKQAYRHLAELKVKDKSIVVIQTCWRRYSAQRNYVLFKLQLKGAVLLQKQFRGRLERKRFYENYYALLDARSKREGAELAQRVFRGWRHRLMCAHIRAVRDGPVSYEQWQKVQKKSKPLRTVGVFTEYLLHGEGCTTEERVLTVLFYCDRITKVCQWEKPPIVVQKDFEDYLDRLELWRIGYVCPFCLGFVFVLAFDWHFSVSTYI